MKRHALVCLLAYAPLACRTVSPVESAVRQDYESSRTAWRRGNANEALRQFPTAEAGGFITTFEKAWIGFPAGQSQPDALVAMTRNMEDRKTLRVSREANSFFYKDAPDGYYPAEHEAIAIHLVSAMLLLQSGRKADAAVDVRRAALYLERDFGAQTGFDDPALRAWLGALWLAVGEWDHARIDFKAAAALAPKNVELQKLAALSSPPKTFALVLSGFGAYPVWKPEAAIDLVGGWTKLQFLPSDEPRAFTLVDGPTTKVKASAPLPTLTWYDRHQERDHAIKDVLDRSEYMVRAAGGGLAASGVYALGTGAAIGIGALGIAAGGLAVWGTIRLIVLTKMPGDVAAYTLAGGGLIGLGIAALGIGAGRSVYRASKRGSQEIMESALSKADVYRFVRFLPDYVHVVATDLKMESPKLAGEYSRMNPTMAVQGVKSDDQVLIFVTQSETGHNALALQKGVDIFVAADARTQEDAEALCSAQGGKWRLPDYGELTAALRAGKVNLPPKAEYAWLRAVGATGMAPCMALRLGERPREEPRHCFQPSAVVCVGG